MIEAGEVLAVKGLGGYHLMCDAFNEAAVEKLRQIKNRESKPFAVMCSDLDAVREIAYVSEKEAEILHSWQHPVVLLSSGNIAANGVSNGLDKIGVMLPYLPFHHLMFRQLRTNCVVLTSGNISDEPIIISNEEALGKFLPLTAAVVTNNRDIYNRCDDSVVAVVEERIMSVRRSRGYVPSPVRIMDDAEGIFGAGAELVNCFAIGKGEQVMLSQHIGDLKNAETFDFYKETYDRFAKLFRFKPALVVGDLHTSYLSRQFAGELADRSSAPLIFVQHHHAHIVSCMAEHHLDEPVIGISMDGVGLGTDGHIWGGEFMVATRDDFKRLKHLDYVAIAGGDKVACEPWRSAVAYLHRYLGEQGVEYFSSYLNEKEKGELSLYKNLLAKNIHTFQYSSAGRLFDAVAALSGVCLHAGFHAEAPMRLESAIDKNIKCCYPFEIKDEIISFGPAIFEIVKDRQKGVPPSEISARFHNSVVEAVFQCSLQISADTGIRKVVVSGGTFQNVYLVSRLINKFSQTQLSFFFQQQVPSNDGGLALGQVAIASKRRKLGI
jgi:hydrogenase maturation protein HypF